MKERKAEKEREDNIPDLTGRASSNNLRNAED